MSYGYLALAAVTVIAGYMSAEAKKKAMLNQADTADENAEFTILTANQKMRRNTSTGKKTQFQMLAEAGTNQGKINAIAAKGVGAAQAESGGSGAIVGSGTTRANLRSIAQEAFIANMDIALGTKRNIDSVIQETKDNNKSIYDKAKFDSESLTGQGEALRDGADNQYISDLLNTGVSAGTIASKATFKSDTPSTEDTIEPGDSGGTDGNEGLNQPTHQPNQISSNNMQGDNSLYGKKSNKKNNQGIYGKNQIG